MKVAVVPRRWCACSWATCKQAPLWAKVLCHSGDRIGQLCRADAHGYTMHHGCSLLSSRTPLVLVAVRGPVLQLLVSRRCRNCCKCAPCCKADTCLHGLQAAVAADSNSDSEWEAAEAESEEGEVTGSDEPSEDELEEEEEAEPVKGKGAKANWDAKGSRRKRQVGHGMRVFLSKYCWVSGLFPEMYRAAGSIRRAADALRPRLVLT